MLPKWVKEECLTEFNQKMFVSCETIQLLLSFANEINVNNNYISIKYGLSLMWIPYLNVVKGKPWKIIKMTWKQLEIVDPEGQWPMWALMYKQEQCSTFDIDKDK